MAAPDPLRLFMRMPCQGSVPEGFFINELNQLDFFGCLSLLFMIRMAQAEAEFAEKWDMESA